jgi:integrase
MAADIKVFGPYRHHGGYRCQLIINGQRSWTPGATTPDRAYQIAQRSVERIQSAFPLSVGDAVERYAAHLKELGNKPASYEGTPIRLRCFFAKVLAKPLSTLSPPRCESLYRDLTTLKSEKTQRPLAVATHKAYLADAKSMCRWAVKVGLLRKSPLDDVKGIGRVRRGKSQLRIDEARRWLKTAHELAAAGEDGAIAAMMTLLMGMRAGEVVSRVVRDLDDGGRLLWIPDSKTDAGKRTVKVPDELQAYLRDLCRCKTPLAPLFGVHWRDWPRQWVKRICEQAQVPTVCAHSMRGLHATLAIQAGASPDIVARSLGHESATMTLSAYAAPGSAAGAQQSTVLATLKNHPI